MNRIILSLALLAGLVLAGNTGLSAQPLDKEERQRKIESAQKQFQKLEELMKEGERFRKPSFRLLWAREAYRCGNVKSAFDDWETLAKGGNKSARYIISLFEGWWALSENKSEGAVYALKLFRPGDGTSDTCQIGRQ